MCQLWLKRYGELTKRFDSRSRLVDPKTERRVMNSCSQLELLSINPCTEIR